MKHQNNMKYSNGLFLKIISLSVFLLVINIQSQTVLKINAPFTVIGIVNLAVEKPFGKNISLQAEGFISPWKSFHGKNLQIYMGTLEGRYYFNEIMKKWYVGTYGSIAAFDLQKWNYLTKQPVLDDVGNSQYLDDGSIRTAEMYQRGVAFVFGISGGYHFTVSENLGLDVFAGIGSVQSFYKGYIKENNERYDKAKNWNKSGEIIPTRAGLMITYILP
ncbi:DUF3575 domain-containing protein [Chryseobacterium sp. CBo1]|uniref:DUF3575 domain-containing protein n=1 Tax=Chryseobacterium sp. CBo1 TaxID=1869230 RepID=UPI001E47F4BD|nr:DUF3575 domain-containing protein [Chryseobacterium sp. CBo1]